jgi:hypothetical protein
MQLSSTLCRAREAHHHALASATTLDNVRQIANVAAAAWAKERVAAGVREDRKLSTRAFAEAHLLLNEPPPPITADSWQIPTAGMPILVE